MPTKREVSTEVHYMEPVRPRNCRKDRVRENVFLANAEFDCFTEEEAPVALIVKHYDSHYEFFVGTCDTHKITFEDADDLLCDPMLRRWGCGIDMVVEVEEDDIR